MNHANTQRGLKRRSGLNRLIKRYVRAFQIPENLAHYADDDLTRAQRAICQMPATACGWPEPGGAAWAIDRHVAPIVTHGTTSF